MKKMIQLLILVATICGCGVRGDPIPPGTPAELGRGKPNYKRATEDLAFPVSTPPGADEDEPEESEDE
jgi:hypothetical protein